MAWRSKFFQIIFCSIFSIISYPTAALSQIIPDSSLGHESSTVTPTAINNSIVDLIEGGATRESNLFHSFRDFNVSDGKAVYFANPDDITNILTRVTGNNLSQIFGTLGVKGAANLWLLNPNGIVFGENYALDLNGSFFATTAESYIFDAADEFSAVQPTTAPLLNISLIPGLQMGSNSDKITVRGNGHLLTGGVFFPIANNTVAQLQVSSGQTLGLVANGIELDGGVLKTSGGNIDLISIRQGKVSLSQKLSHWELNPTSATEFADIRLHQQALVDTSGIATGNIRLQGQNISLEDASAAIIQNFGPQTSGNILIAAHDSLTLSGSAINAPDLSISSGNPTRVVSSRLTTETVGTGQSGNVTVFARNLSIVDGGSISARSFTDGNTGNLDIAIDGLITVDRSSVLNPLIPSLISTTIFGSGDSGTIRIAAQNLKIINGGTVSALSFGSGQGGDVELQVMEELVIAGVDANNFAPSTFGGTVYRTGDSGKITVDVKRLSLLDGGRISTATLAEGNAGQLEVRATESIEIRGATVNKNFVSSIASNGEVVSPILQEFLGVPEQPSGKSGNIIIETPSLKLLDGGAVEVNNQGLGDSGSVNIDADRIVLDTDAKITAFSFLGQGGNINLNSKDSLSLANNSRIVAEAAGNSIGDEDHSSIDGGNINIMTDLISLLGNSQIDADAVGGNGGNINITAQGLFVSADSRVSASSKFGLDGNIKVENINDERSIELVKLAANLTDATKHITTGCDINSDFALSGKGGLPENPGQNLRGQATWQDLRLPKIKSSSTVSPLRNLTSSALREANSWQITPQGKVILLAREQGQTNFSARVFDCAKFAGS